MVITTNDTSASDMSHENNPLYWTGFIADDRFHLIITLVGGECGGDFESLETN